MRDPQFSQRILKLSHILVNMQKLIKLPYLILLQLAYLLIVNIIIVNMCLMKVHFIKTTTLSFDHNYNLISRKMLIISFYCKNYSQFKIIINHYISSFFSLNGLIVISISKVN